MTDEEKLAEKEQMLNEGCMEISEEWRKKAGCDGCQYSERQCYCSWWSMGYSGGPPCQEGALE